MFWRKKENETPGEADEEKKPGRRVFGFLCSPGIYAVAKVTARELNIPLYAVCEHALQIGIDDIRAAMQDTQEKEVLLQHLNDEHLLTHLMISLGKYDIEAAQIVRDKQRRQHEKQLLVNDLLDICQHYGLDPKRLPEIVGWYLKRITEARQHSSPRYGNGHDNPQESH